MVHPQNVKAVAEEEAARIPVDVKVRESRAEYCARHAKIDAAIAEAERRIRELPEFNDWVSTLVTGAISEMVYAAYHDANVRARKAAGLYDTVPRVSGGGPGVREVIESAFKKRPEGKKRGKKRGEQQ